MAIRVLIDGEVVHVAWEGEPDEESLRRYFVDIADVSRRLPRYAILYDLRRAELPTASRRRLLATMSQRMPPEVRVNCIAIAFVTASAVIRAALVAVTWLQPMKVEHLVAETIEEAEPWIASRLREAARTIDEAEG